MSTISQLPEFLVKCRFSFSWSGVGLRLCIYSCCCYPWTVSLITREEGLPVLGVMSEERTGRSQHSVRDVCLPPLHRDSPNPLLLVWCPVLQCAWCSQIQTLGFNLGEKLLLFCLGWESERSKCSVKGTGGEGFSW